MQDQCVQLADLSATRSLGRQLALTWLALPVPKPVFLLEGDLGAGKTTLVQGIGQGFGIEEPITSPTFALSHRYNGPRGLLIHLDLYRLEAPFYADELFFQEEEEAQLCGGLVVVEWPQRLSFVPENVCFIKLEPIDPVKVDVGRLATVKSHLLRNF